LKDGQQTMNNEVAAAALESLGNETRLAIYRLLVRAGQTGMPVGKLKDAVSIPGSTLSHHIARLVATGLVSQHREGRVLRCTANYQTMQNLLDFLVEECCQDDPCCDS
jgi:DNA-binding transcriptional ArsR family regulator